jgi:hypothetical protein
MGRTVVTSSKVCDTSRVWHGSGTCLTPLWHLDAELAPERSLVDVVDEGARAVDLDDRQPFAIARLELIVAGDVDLLVREVELRTQPLELPLRAPAQVAARGVVQRDPTDTARA